MYSPYGDKCARKEGHREVGYLFYRYVRGQINKEGIITGKIRTCTVSYSRLC